MTMTSGDLAAMVFKRVVGDGQDSYSLDSQMLNVLIELDGEKSVSDVAKQMGLNMGMIRHVIGNLMKLRLIEPVENGFMMLDRAFFDFLKGELSHVIGPIAEVLIEDAVADLGHEPDRFPRHRAAELVDILSRQIQREDKRVIFKRNMVKKITNTPG